MEERSSSIRVIFCVTVRVTGVFGSGKKYPGKTAAGKAVDLDVLKKYSSEANKDFEKFLSAAMSNNQSGTLLHLTALVADLKILENEINK